MQEFILTNELFFIEAHKKTLELFLAIAETSGFGRIGNRGDGVAHFGGLQLLLGQLAASGRVEAVM